MKRSAALIVTSVALATDMLVYGIAIPVLPRIASSSGASASAVGVLFACYAIAMVIATPVAGVLVDRLGHRVPMLAGLFALAGSTVLFAVVQALPALMVARALQGVAAAVSWTAGLALIASVYPAAERAKPLGLALSASGLGVLLGPAIGGFLADHWGTRAPFMLAAAVALLDGVARVVLVRDGEHVPAERPGRVWRHPTTGLMFGLTALGAGLIAFLEPILPLRAAAAFSASTPTHHRPAFRGGRAGRRDRGLAQRFRRGQGATYGVGRSGCGGRRGRRLGPRRDERRAVDARRRSGVGRDRLATGPRPDHRADLRDRRRAVATGVRRRLRALQHRLHDRVDDRAAARRRPQRRPSVCRLSGSPPRPSPPCWPLPPPSPAAADPLSPVQALNPSTNPVRQRTYGGCLCGPCGRGG
nr:MFS transporter [Fodinicola feengrottensis]